MARVIITDSLQREVMRKFKSESKKVFVAMKALEDKPRKGRTIAHIQGVVIKEIRHRKFRFYFIADGHVLKFGTSEELANLLIKFVRMSEKKDQQKTIDGIKSVLKSLGFDAW